MAPPGAESQTLRDLFGEDLDEEVDYESNSQFVGPNGSPHTTITGEGDESRAPSSAIEHGAADTLTALRNSPDLTSRLRLSPTRSTSSNNNGLPTKIARSEGQRHWPTWPSRKTMSFTLPQMRSAFEGQQVVPSRVGFLGQRLRLLEKSLRAQRFAHGYYSLRSCR